MARVPPFAWLLLLAACTVDAVVGDDPPAYTATDLPTGLQRMGIERIDSQGCAWMTLAAPMDSDAWDVRMPSGWALERAYAAPAEACADLPADERTDATAATGTILFHGEDAYAPTAIDIEVLITLDDGDTVLFDVTGLVPGP